MLEVIYTWKHLHRCLLRRESHGKTINAICTAVRPPIHWRFRWSDSVRRTLHHLSIELETCSVLWSSWSNWRASVPSLMSASLLKLSHTDHLWWHPALDQWERRPEQACALIGRFQWPHFRALSSHGWQDTCCVSLWGSVHTTWPSPSCSTVKSMQCSKTLEKWSVDCRPHLIQATSSTLKFLDSA